MKRFLTAAALAIVLMPSRAWSQAPTLDTLYDAMLQITRHEFLLDEKGNKHIDPLIAEVTGRWLPHLEEAADIGAADIEDLLTTGTKLCDRKNLTITECLNVRATAEPLIAREEKTLILGVDLQILASSFEEPLLGGFALPFEDHVRAIDRMWRADLDGATAEESPASSLRIRTAPVGKPAALEGFFAELVRGFDTIGKDNPSAVTAAVWRYRFAGVNYLNDKRPDLPAPPKDILESASGTERTLLMKNWLNIEEPLQNISAALTDDADGLNIAKGESVFFTFPRELTAALPGNVRVWAYVERLQDGKLASDAGLHWIFAIEPAPLTLCSEEEGSCVPVPGGHYPPPPVEVSVRPLCTHPLMRGKGLCLEIRQTEEEAFQENQMEECAESVPPSRDTIQLAACTRPQPPRETDMGGDACGDLSWQIPSGEGEATEDVCTPLQKTTFHSTIGNAMCFFNRCLQQSLSQHRLIPGRVPLTVGEPAYPFDLCLRPDSESGSIIAGPRPVAAGWAPLAYRPALLLQRLEETLCPGLPLGSPLCAFNPLRAITRPTNDLEALSKALVNQEKEFQEPLLLLQQLSDAIGIRIGTRLYADLLKHKAQGLTDFSTEAASLLSQFTRASFPSITCPMNLSNAQDFCRDLSHAP